MINRLNVNIYRGLYNRFHGFKIAFMTHKKNLKKKKTQKQRREIHAYNSLDGRFDRNFYYGFHKHQIA